MKTLILTATLITSGFMIQAQSNEFLFKAMVVSGSVVKKSTTRLHRPALCCQRCHSYSK